MQHLQNCRALTLTLLGLRGRILVEAQGRTWFTKSVTQDLQNLEKAPSLEIVMQEYTGHRRSKYYTHV